MSLLEEENYSANDSGSVEPDLPDVTEPQTKDEEEQYDQLEDEEFSAPQSSVNEDSEDASASMIAQWRNKYRAEIEEKDAADEEGKRELKEEAVKHIDDFYENYNRKKEQQLATVKAEAEEFLKQKENFFSQENTTTWDRALQLINEDDADVLGDRDRSKFKEILQRLKGKTSAPGA